jgi:Tol biopolymer transport system component
MTRLRWFLLIGAAAAAIAGIAVIRTRVAPEVRTLAWVATAHQFGPVGYRDPAGALSHDGKWIAYSEGRFLRVRSIGGGPVQDFVPGSAQIRTVVWTPDSNVVLADGDTTPASWGAYDRAAGTRAAWWPDRAALANTLRQPAWSVDGQSVAAVRIGGSGNELWRGSNAGAESSSQAIDAWIAFPAWTPNGEVACIATRDGRARVTVPCGGPPLRAQPDADAYGPLAFSPDGAVAYVSLANASGTVDLWAIPTGAGRARQLTFFDGDTYAPSVAADGTVLFKVQSYRTHVAEVAADGGPTRALATFRSETPSWDPTGKWLGITYGTWRRVADDAKYPDIAQDAGIIAADASHPADAPASIVHDSVSEDQALCWSPNGEWLAFHSHKDRSDDIWLRRASGDPSARRITMLGRGAEAGWPRWSPDGRWLVFNAASRTTRHTVLYRLGMDQGRGEVTQPLVEIPIAGVEGDIGHAEWIDRGDTLVAIGKETPGRHVIFTVSRDGGTARVVYRFPSEHDNPGLGVSPDGSAAAFIAPAGDGFFQVFRLPLAGGPPVQLTRDPSNKTQPAWSPDGRRIAFTVWNYEAQFWRISPS